MKEKISISVEESLVRRADSLVDGMVIRNRSQAIEHVISSFFSSSGIEVAVVLIGREKKIGSSLIRHIIGVCKSASAKTVIFAGGPNNDAIFSVLGTESNGMKIDYVKEQELRGTAGALWLARDKLKGTFLVLAGDTVFSFDLAKMVKSHESKQSIATMGITAVKLEDSTDSIIVEGDKVVHFNYQDRKPTYMTNAGAYVFEPEIFRYMPKKGSLEKDVFPKLAQEGKLNSYVFYREMKQRD